MSDFRVVVRELLNLMRPFVYVFRAFRYIYQGYGKSLWMMHGLFRSNGGSGYFKKPDLLMRRGPNNEVFDPKLTLPVRKTLKVRNRIQTYSLCLYE